MNLYRKNNCKKITRDISRSVLDDPNCSKGSIYSVVKGHVQFMVLLDL